MECIIKLNTTIEVPETNTISLELSGEAFVHFRLERFLNQGLHPRRILTDFEFLRVNTFPTRIVQIRCDDITSSDWTCERKADKCITLINMIGEQVKMMEHTLQSHHSYDLIGPIWRVDRFCSVSIQLKMWFEGRKYICSGPDRLVTNGRQQCQIFFDCVDRAIEALFQYASHVDDCNQKYGINNNHSMEYGIETSLKEEYVRKKMFKESFPSHFFGQCSGRIPVVIVDIPYRTKDTVECRRRTDNIIKSIDTLKTCHDFVATCKKTFDCLENLQPCTSVKFGPETSSGFEMENIKNFPYSQEMPPCDHWAVQITVGVHTNNLLCAAKRIFRVKSFEFCESYEWVCQKVLDCLNTREFCIYSPNKATNFGFEEDVRAGILNFQMGEISEKNPRELIKQLYECNKRLGYPQFVHLYFSTVACVEKDVCYTNVFEEEDE